MEIWTVRTTFLRIGLNYLIGLRRPSFVHLVRYIEAHLNTTESEICLSINHHSSPLKEIEQGLYLEMAWI